MAHNQRMSKREAIASCMYAILSAIAIVAMAVMVVLLSGCKTIKEVPVEVVKERIEYIDRLQTDSIYQHDSIYIKAVGDTIYEYRDKYIYKYKFIRDTSYITKIDSIPVIIEVEKKLSRWDEAKLSVGGYAIPILLLILLIGIGFLIKKLKG